MAQGTPATTLENLNRLAAKPGVQSTLILSKTDGTVIQSTGLLAASESEEAIAPQSPSGKTKLEGSENADVRGDGPDQPKRSNTAEDVARMVFAFVTAAKEFSDGMYTTDEVKLLRMRTRKNEIVIVPDPKFLLVVIHDTPPA